MNRAGSGQSLAEYGLVAILVGVASIGSLVLLGGSLSNALQNIWPQAPASSQQIDASEPSTTPVETLMEKGVEVNGPDVMVKLASGTVITVKNFALNMDQSRDLISTTGANGATRLQASQLVALADQLQAAGELTPNEATTLKELANQGFKIAQIEEIVEKAIANSSSTAEFATTPVTFNGRTYTNANDLVSQNIGFEAWLGYEGEPITSLDPFMDAATGGRTRPETELFQKLYQEALSQPGVQAIPEVQSIIETLGTQILYTSELLEDASYKVWGAYTYQQEDPTLTPVELFTSIVPIKASLLTDQDSTGICNTGDGTVDKRNCS